MVILMTAIQSNLSEIEVLTQRHSWEFYVYVAVGIIVPVILAILSWRVWYTSNRLQDAIKRDAEVKIEQARTEAAQANEGLGKANQEIARLSFETAKANERTEELKTRNLELQQRIEAERGERLGLQEAVAPRSAGHQGRFTEKLKPFRGTQFVVESIPDSEPSQMAGELTTVLLLAGWEPFATTPQTKSEHFFEGITVESAPRRQINRADYSLVENNAHPVAEALIAELKNLNIKTMRIASELPPGKVRIRGGPKPRTYFLPQEVKDYLKAQEQKK